MCIYLLDTFLSNLVLAAVPLVQNEGPTPLNRCGVNPHTFAHFIRPCQHSDESYLFNFTGTARPRIASNPPSRDADTGEPEDVTSTFHCQPLLRNPRQTSC